MKKEKSKVSVILPTYNRAQFVWQAIESILSQTYSNYELLVIDDGSTDNTRDTVQKYCRKHPNKVKYLYQENQRQCVARDLALKQAAGHYLGFIDDDEQWLPTKMEKQAALLDKNPDIAFVSCAAHIIDEKDTIKNTFKKAANYKETFEDLYTGGFITYPLTVMVRRSAYDAVGGYDPDMLITEGNDLWLRIAKKYPFKYINEPLAQYRKHYCNVTHDLDFCLKQRIRSITKDEITQGLNKKIKAIGIAKTYFKFASYFYFARDFKKAAKNYGKAIMTYPLVGRFFWTSGVKNMKFSLPYRVIKPYISIIDCSGKEMFKNLKGCFHHA